MRVSDRFVMVIVACLLPAFILLFKTRTEEITTLSSLCHWAGDTVIPEDEGGSVTAGSEKLKVSVDVTRKPGTFNMQFNLKQLPKAKRRQLDYSSSWCLGLKIRSLSFT